MMAMKRMFFMLALLSLLGTSTVVFADSASVTPNVDYLQKNIKASYSSDLPYNTAVTFYLLKSDAEYSTENYLRMAEADFIPGGKTECLIPLGTDINCREGKEHCEAYKIYAVPGGLKSSDFSVISSDFVICCQEKQNDLLSSINTKPEDEAFQSYKSILSDYLYIDTTGADPDIGMYIKQMQKDDYGGNYSNLGELPKAWEVSNTLKKVNSAVDSDDLKAIVTGNAEALGIDTDDAFYKMDTDGVYTRLFSSIDTDKAYSLKAFNSKMNNAVAISSFGYACKSDLESLDPVLEKYSEILGIADSDMAAYRDLKKSNKNFSSDFARQFDGYSKTSTQEIGSKFKNLLSDFSKNNGAGNSSAGSGSGGGSGMTIRGEQNGLGSGTVSVTAPAGAKDNNASRGFTDIHEDHWAYSFVMALHDYGVISGYDDGSFRPDARITRGEFIKLITDSLNINGDPAYPISFTDVRADNWVYPYVQRFASAGGISGYEDGSAGVNKNISREDAAVFIERALKIKNTAFIDAESDGFTDEDSISDYAKDAVKTLCGANIITGFEDGSFMPKENLTRAQAAVIIYKASEQYSFL